MFDMWTNVLHRLALITWEPQEGNHGEDGTGADRPWLWGAANDMNRQVGAYQLPRQHITPFHYGNLKDSKNGQEKREYIVCLQKISVSVYVCLCSVDAMTVSWHLAVNGEET